MMKTIINYIAAFDYIDMTLLVLSATSGSDSAASFATVIGAPVEITSASLSLVFPLVTELLKKLLKTMSKKKNKHNKIVLIASSTLNSIENLICIALKDNEISYEDFTTIINEERNYRKLKIRI